jgi:hypothetical protein
MKRQLATLRIILSAAAFASPLAARDRAPAVVSVPTAGPVVQIEDVDRFYAIYDAASGHPTAEQLQRDYLDAGSEGLHQFAKLRKISGEAIAAALSKRPELYADAKRCLAVLPQVRTRLEAVLRKLGTLYPEARFPPVTIAVGRGKPVAIGSPVSGLQVGLEALCAANSLNPDVEERFVHVIAHEFAHVQQASVLVDDEHPTVLAGALGEGAAEFVAELISGSVAYSRLAEWSRGREREFETAFVPEQDRTDLSKWLYNGEGTREWPGDLGYWIGYRIVKAYYRHSVDKRRALREILEMTEPRKFLVRSGWYPGISLE